MPRITAELPRELSDFALSCAEAKHYGNLDRVICNALRLLRQREERRHELLAILNVSLAEAEHGAGVSLEEVMQKSKEIIESGGRHRTLVNVEVSDWLAREAKLYGDIHQRSMGEQIEHWVRIGLIAEANPDTPYGVIFDECGLGLEPCDPPIGDILQPKSGS